MSTAPPVVGSDVPHDAASMREYIATQISANVPGWVESNPQSGPDQASAALIGVFARFCEIVIQRLNQVPDKNLLAFLDLLGANRLPPQPARVPLTFTLATGSVSDTVVPAGTQAAALPLEGETDPVIFETESELTVVAATLQALFAADAQRDLIADHSALLASPSATGVRIFAGDRASERLLYIGHPRYPDNQTLETLAVEIQLHAPPSADQVQIAPADLQWETWNGTAWDVLAPQDVGRPTQLDGVFTFATLAPISAQIIAGVNSHWLRCRLLKPVSPEPLALGMASASLLPVFGSVQVRASTARSEFSPDAAFANAQSTDTSGPFFPFGERPKLGDAFYLASGEAFGQPGAVITLGLTVLNPASATAPPPDAPPPLPTQASPDLTLRWEVWTGAGWTFLGDSTPTSTGSSQFGDFTKAFTNATSNIVSFTLPDTPALTTLNGVTSYWIRVRITLGNYGADARYVKDTSQAGGFNLIPATFAPPIISEATISYQYAGPLLPADVLAYNDFTFDNIGAGLAHGIAAQPFRALPAQLPALYAAFALPPARTAFPNRTVSLFPALKSFAYGEHVVPVHPDVSIQTAVAGATATHIYTLTNASSETVTYDIGAPGGAWARTVSPLQATLPPGQSTPLTVTVTVPPLTDDVEGPASDRGFLQLRASTDGSLSSVTFETRVGAVASRQRSLRWEYWNGSDWKTLAVVDGTDRLAQPGLVEFLGPSDLTLASHFGVSGYWVRALFELGDDAVEPRLRALLPNTTFAAQTVTVHNELLGSSDASKSQQFRTTRSPVLASQQLEVLETGPLSAEDLAALEAAYGAGGVTPADNGSANAVWVRWIEVPDLYGSGPQDRHYILDHITGDVRFGDGTQGRIPPRGAGNVRMALYQTGGGDAGDRAAGTIVQMKTTVPYIDQVFNVEAAAGGFGAESLDALVTRAPRTLRHGGRAVAAEDYEDLARLASPEVARARCVPLRLLQNDPLGSTPLAGAVSVIVVPGSADPKPLPSVELLAGVEEFLRARKAVIAEIAAVGPLYVRVDVVAEVVLTSLEGASQVEQTILTQLAAFLHPLTGGRDGAGWDFGRQPHLSDLYAVVSSVPQVDHIRQLSMTQLEDLAGAIATGRFLVYSGQHQITLTFGVQ